ncbi:MAG TPA: BON domain-containing protein [Burkholderiaceae bacterium]|nr:BON domain-containing protein [Burkholderiaceae bacterium]
MKLQELAKPATLAAAFLAALSMTACSRHDDGQTVGQKLDSAVQSAKESAHDAKEEAKSATGQAAADTKSATREAGDKVADAAITTSINADLAKDPDLSALKIDVDTSNGRVTLHGTAPSDTAKQRATKLASNVKGVTSVDNQLTVQK